MDSVWRPPMSEISESNIDQPLVARQNPHDARIRGVEYCVNEWGEKDAPLCFLPSRLGRYRAQHFNSLSTPWASDWRVIAPDWRGFGRSSS